MKDLNGKQYSSFEEIAKDFGCKQVRKKTRNPQKLEAQREIFYKRHLCSACGQPMKWINGTNIMCCANPNCDGIPVKIEGDESAKIYLMSFDMLDDTGAEIANNILE